MSGDAEKHKKSSLGEALYAQLPEISATCEQKLKSQLQSVQSLLESYGSFVAGATAALGSVAPQNRHDEIIRDLIADVFDFLYEWPRPLFEGRPNVAFPLARRAYESLSLLSACYQKQAIADRWDNDKQIGNAAIRKALANLPYPESEQAMKDLYKFFTEGAHPNRSLIAQRFLGDGNKFTLGSNVEPELCLVLNHCMHLVDMWFWFGALVMKFAVDTFSDIDYAILKNYRDIATRASALKRWLAESFTKELKARQDALNKEGY